MKRKLSMLVPDCWDFTISDSRILRDAVQLTGKDIFQLSREGVKLLYITSGKNFIWRMSLLADHPKVRFNYYRGGIGTCETEMH